MPKPLELVICGPNASAAPGVAGSSSLLASLIDAAERAEPGQSFGPLFANLHSFLRTPIPSNETARLHQGLQTFDARCITSGDDRHPQLVACLSTADVVLIIAPTRLGVPDWFRQAAFLASTFRVPHLIVAIAPVDPDNQPGTSFEAMLSSYCEQLHCHASFVHLSHTPADDAKNILAQLKQVTARNRAAGFRAIVETPASPSPKPGTHLVRIISGYLPEHADIRLLPGATLTHASFAEDRDPRFAMMRLDESLMAAAGDVVVLAHEPCEVSDQFEAEMFWLDSGRGFTGRAYQLQLGGKTAAATLLEVKGRYSLTTLDLLSSRTLRPGHTGKVTFGTDIPLPFEPFDKCAALGAFILTDPYRQQVVGAGIVNFALRRSHNIHRQALVVDKRARATMNGHCARVLWLTGLSGSGKSTIADALEQTLHARGVRTYILDGDNIRHGLNKDLGFTSADRVENIRRIAEVARLMVDAGLVVITAFISPFRAERDMARSLFDADEFVEIYVEVPLAVAEARDPKGLYKLARSGDLPNFTGIDSPYEAPLDAELTLDTSIIPVFGCVAKILEAIEFDPI